MPSTTDATEHCELLVTCPVRACWPRPQAAFGSPRPNAGEGRCEKNEKRLLPTLSVRRSARATLVERALRARFHLWIRRRDGSGLAQLNFFTASGVWG